MINDAAREFGEWLADRLPEDMLMPSKSVAVQDAVDALGAILRKHSQPAPGTYPRLIESGPLPEGRLVIYGRLDWSTWNMCSGPMSEKSANEWRSMGFSFYDYGPLPQKGGE